MTAALIPAAPPSVAAGPATSAEQMLDALKRAPTDTLARAMSVLHESALERGLLLMPIERLARRGISSVNLTSLPSVCSVCEEAGQWRSGPFEDCLICCNDCLTIVHQDFRCSRMDQELLHDEGHLAMCRVYLGECTAVAAAAVAATASRNIVPDLEPC